MHEYEIRILSFLKGKKEVSFDDLQETGLGRDPLLWTIENLSGSGAVSVKKEQYVKAELSNEGEKYLGGFPEETLLNEIAGGKEILVSKAEKIGLMWAKKNGWVQISGEKLIITDEGRKIASGKQKYKLTEVLSALRSMKGGKLLDFIQKNKESVDMLIKRNLVETAIKSSIVSVSATEKGVRLLSESKPDKGVGQITKEIIARHTWEASGFRKYDISAPAETQYPARTHLLREFVNLVRLKWLEMGFVEVSGPIVESAFWNFDALFSPQDHPTREMQDTFFLSNPKQMTIEDVEVMDRVKKMHKNGWKEKWSEALASNAILRTHTTSVSARYMHKLSKAIDANYPLKLFSVGSVFRNENVDYKHLAELHMYDGIIVGDGLTFANLIDTLRRFYAKLGLDNIKFRPSYFPFTEPSLEAYYYDEEHHDSIELTGGGIIRKEITKAMGIDKTVLAWGGGIDRLLLNSKIFGMDSILTLYKNNIDWLRTRKSIRV